MKTFIGMKQHTILLWLVLALVATGAAPLAGGYDAAAAKKGKNQQVTAQDGVHAQAVQSFENTKQLGMGDDAPAESSTIQVSGFSAPVVDVEVTLLDINFGPASSQDMDVLLIGPEGKTSLLLSDVGGNTATSHVTLLLDDQADTQLPDNTALKTGIFQPTNLGSGDTIRFVGSDITPPTGAALGVFNGINPNGAWSLSAYDDTGNGNVGVINGWRLRIKTANGVPSAGADSFQATAGQPLTVPATGVLSNDSDPDADTLTAIVAGQPKQGALTLQPDGGFTYTPNKKASGSDSFTYLAQDPGGLNALANVDIQITKAKKKHKKGKK